MIPYAENRTQALLAIADVARNPADADVRPAFDFTQSELKRGIRVAPWVLVRLARVCVEAKMLELSFKESLASGVVHEDR